MSDPMMPFMVVACLFLGFVALITWIIGWWN